MEVIVLLIHQYYVARYKSIKDYKG